MVCNIISKVGSSYGDYLFKLIARFFLLYRAKKLIVVFFKTYSSYLKLNIGTLEWNIDQNKKYTFSKILVYIKTHFQQRHLVFQTKHSMYYKEEKNYIVR